MALPLHRGPHRDYSAMVCERLGEIERLWSRQRRRDAALTAVTSLQAALRRELLTPSRTVRLNRHDPWSAGVDFTRLDAMADALWGATQPAAEPVSLRSAAIAA